MTTDSANSVPDRRAETPSSSVHGHREREAPGGILDLDALPPLPTPKSLRWPVVGTRMPAHRLAWLREVAAADGITVNALVNRILGEAQTGGWPADVREWLLMQAGQCGCPGDPHQALVLVVRHLADLWPYGARLRR